MLAKDLIYEGIVPLKTSDTGATGLKLMEEYKVSHLPIVNNVDLLGLISEEDLYSHNNLDDVIGNHTLSLNQSSIDQYGHMYDVINIIAEQKLTLLPVVDKADGYLGVITLPVLIQKFALNSGIQNPGGIIVLELNEIDFSMTEISTIVEGNDAKILNSFVTTHADSTKIEVTLKLNKMDIYPVLQTFYRYNYIVLASFNESNYMNGLKDRFDSLMSYLNV
jgi:CBS domain-containing protein